MLSKKAEDKLFNDITAINELLDDRFISDERRRKLLSELNRLIAEWNENQELIASQYQRPEEAHAKMVQKLIKRAFDDVDSDAYSTIMHLETNPDSTIFDFTFFPSWNEYNQSHLSYRERDLSTSFDRRVTYQIADHLKTSLTHILSTLKQLPLEDFQYELHENHSDDDLADYFIQGQIIIGNFSLPRRSNPMATGTLLALGIGYLLGKK